MTDRTRLVDLTIPEERAFLIGIDSRDGWPVARSLAELAALAETAGAAIRARASIMPGAPRLLPRNRPGGREARF